MWLILFQLQTCLATMKCPEDLTGWRGTWAILAYSPQTHCMNPTWCQAPEGAVFAVPQTCQAIPCQSPHPAEGLPLLQGCCGISYWCWPETQGRSGWNGILSCSTFKVKAEPDAARWCCRYSGVSQNIGALWDQEFRHLGLPVTLWFKQLLNLSEPRLYNKAINPGAKASLADSTENMRWSWSLGCSVNHSMLSRAL